MRGWWNALAVGLMSHVNCTGGSVLDLFGIIQDKLWQRSREDSLWKIRFAEELFAELRRLRSHFLYFSLLEEEEAKDKSGLVEDTTLWRVTTTTTTAMHACTTIAVRLGGCCVDRIGTTGPGQGLTEASPPWLCKGHVPTPQWELQSVEQLLPVVPRQCFSLPFFGWAGVWSPIVKICYDGKIRRENLQVDYQWQSKASKTRKPSTAESVIIDKDYWKWQDRRDRAFVLLFNAWTVTEREDFA